MGFIIERGIYKSKLILDNNINESDYISRILNSKYTLTHWEKNDSGIATPIKTILFEDNIFYSGLATIIKNDIIDMGYDCRIINDKTYIERDINISLERVQVGLGDIVLRDYQKEAIIKAARKPLTLTSLPTGAGKSLVMSALLLADDIETLIVVDSKTLMYQLAENIKLFTGIECGIVGDSNFYPKRWTVAVIDSLLQGKGYDLIYNYKALYIDEAHKSGAKSYILLIDRGRKNIIVRRGFSGTTYRNDNKTFLLPAMTGPIVTHYTTSQMIDAGWLAVPHICTPIINNFYSKDPYYTRMYNKCIISNMVRNNKCVDVLVEFANRGYLVAGFYKNVQKHLPIIRALVYKAFSKDKVGIINGGTASTIRQKILQQFATGDKRILLASIGTTGEGIDLPGDTKLGVNFAGGCSEIAIRQLLGRILRKPKRQDTKEVDTKKPFHVFWYDPYDKTNEELERQSCIRYDLYSSEPSFIMEG